MPGPRIAAVAVWPATGRTVRRATERHRVGVALRLHLVEVVALAWRTLRPRTGAGRTRMRMPRERPSLLIVQRTRTFLALGVPGPSRTFAR